MTREQVGKCSLAYVRAITSTLVRRLSESLGVPYKENEETETDTANTTNNKDLHPLYNAENVKHYGNRNPVRNIRDKDVKVYDGNNPIEFRAFWGGVKSSIQK